MTKEVKLGIGAVVLIVFLFAITVGLNHYNYEQSILREKDPKLSEESRKIYEDRLVQAETELVKSELTQDQRYEWLMYKSFQLFGLGKLQSSMDFLTQASLLKPENANPYVMMYTVQMDMQDNRGAHKNIKKALEVNPINPDIWKKYILLERERFGARDEQVRNMYQDALEKTNGHIDIVTSFAVFLESAGDLAGAKGQWEKAIEINPANQSAYVSEIARIEAILKTQ